MAGLGFPFVKEPNDYIKTELNARRDSMVASRMKPWIKITSNIGPNGYTLSSLTYENDGFIDLEFTITYDYAKLDIGPPKYTIKGDI